VDGYPHRISFSGRVHPPRVEIRAPEDRNASFEGEEAAFSMRIWSEIQGSRITVVCYLSKLVDNYLSKAHIVVYNVLRARIGLGSFFLGTGTLILIDKVTDVSGATTDVSFGFPELLSSLCTSFTATTNYAELQRIAITERPLGLALNDLILATELPGHTTINCARAVDGIRNLIAGDDTDSNVAWAMMHKALNVDKAYVQLISDLSKKHRHAKWVFIPEDEQNTSLSRSWTLMDRYFHLRLRKLDCLPIDEFPLLVG
jgi:hypothetical protein